MALLQVNAPGILGMLTAAFNASEAFCKALEAIAEDQTEEGKKMKQDLIRLFAPVNSLIAKIEQKLGIDPFSEPPAK